MLTDIIVIEFMEAKKKYIEPQVELVILDNEISKDYANQTVIHLQNFLFRLRSK